MKKILIVEDDPFLIDIYVTKFEEKGYNIEAARDGEEALRIIENNDFNLVILDINLPKIDGWEVLKRMRKEKKNRECKVIILSNFDNKNEEMTKKMNVDKYIVKVHCTPEEVAQEVEKLI